jgi:hypothetical protein
MRGAGCISDDRDTIRIPDGCTRQEIEAVSHEIGKIETNDDCYN